MLEPQSNTRPLILVVEDEVLVRMTLVDVLEDAGYQVIEAIHADEAISILRALSGVDALITDVEMPQGSMNGFEMAQECERFARILRYLFLPDGPLPMSAICRIELFSSGSLSIQRRWSACSRRSSAQAKAESGFAFTLVESD